MALATTLNTTAKTVHGAINELKASSGSSDVTIKYDSSDDYVYVKDESSTWVKWQKAYIKIFKIVKDKSSAFSYVAGDWNGSSYNGGCSLGMNGEGNLQFSLYANNGGTYPHYCRATTSTRFDTTGFMYLKFRACRSTTASPIQVGLSTSPTSAGTTASDQVSIAVGTTVTATAWTEYSVNISGCQGLYYFAIKDNNNTKGTFYTYFSDVYLSN